MGDALKMSDRGRRGEEGFENTLALQLRLGNVFVIDRFSYRMQLMQFMDAGGCLKIYYTNNHMMSDSNEHILPGTYNSSVFADLASFPVPKTNTTFSGN